MNDVTAKSAGKCPVLGGSHGHAAHAGPGVAKQLQRNRVVANLDADFGEQPFGLILELLERRFVEQFIGRDLPGQESRRRHDPVVRSLRW